MDKDKFTAQQSSKTIIEFDNYYGEWLIPIQIAKQHNEPAPLIVCSGVDIPTTPFTYNQERINTPPWFIPLLQRLRLRDEFTIPFEKHTQNIKVFEVNDVNAYHLIWSRLHTCPIIDFVFAANCDIQKLKHVLKTTYQQQRYIPDPKQLKSLAAWCYWPVDTNQDDHFACYYSKNAKYLELFHYYLDAKHFNQRYQYISCCSGELDEAKFFIEMKLNYQYQQGCYLVFQKPLPSWLDIKTKEQDKQFHNSPTEPDDDDFKQTLGFIRNMLQRLKPILQLPAISEFAHLGVFYKIVAIHDIQILKKLLEDDLAADFIMGFFSIDTDPQSLKKQMVQNQIYMLTESLISLGEWAIVRKSEAIECFPCIIASTNPEDIAVYITGYRTDYSYYETNTKPIFLD